MLYEDEMNFHSLQNIAGSWSLCSLAHWMPFPGHVPQTADWTVIYPSSSIMEATAARRFDGTEHKGYCRRTHHSCKSCPNHASNEAN
ncbi:hypothetical protein GDO78_005252 [Eleutherodactylus coqui]|uniref:Uncharacterized protein n=1 Tax=Eleutherodactylus coqui TaxID=57060 RepID=A0A8J6KED8_ELECQ|nr:hypothetical protein GDO78_005252 [Eleutherodactylus coqui]